MTSRERVFNAVNFKPVDKAALECNVNPVAVYIAPVRIAPVHIALIQKNHLVTFSEWSNKYARSAPDIRGAKFAHNTPLYRTPIADYKLPGGKVQAAFRFFIPVFAFFA